MADILQPRVHVHQPSIHGEEPHVWCVLSAGGLVPKVKVKRVADIVQGIRIVRIFGDPQMVPKMVSEVIYPRSTSALSVWGQLLNYACVGD